MQESKLLDILVKKLVKDNKCKLIFIFIVTAFQQKHDWVRAFEKRLLCIPTKFSSDIKAWYGFSDDKFNFMETARDSSHVTI